ncbi:MAG TPA: gephyrin-like molybdotransferase Glp [Thermoanaerobaculia bacterium]|nr:gephyrin-like molybdotransferase Glp [Thermoanaerobaculia bacterium]
MIRPEDAWDLLEPHLAPLGSETVGRRGAAGRVLAEALAAALDVPGEDVSAVDGYALTEAPEVGRPLPVVGTIAAGDAPGFELPAGTAARIMTGAPVPAAARLVMMVEASDDGRSEVTFHRPAESSDHIRRRGEILRRGDRLLDPGALLTPGALALIATHGFGEVQVVRAPRVAVLATGDEVVPPDREPRPGQLRDSHTDFLLAAGAGLGLAFHSLGIAPDRLEELSALVARGLESDVLLLCGGVSMGEYDLVEGVLGSLGCRLLFDAVAVQPGKPLVAAVHDRGLVFGLPGNPASVMVGFWLFVRPALRRLAGGVDGFWHGALAAELAGPLPGATGRDRFLPARVSFTAGGIRALPVSPRGSHDLAAYAHGTALLRVRAGSPPRQEGEPCEVLPLADWRGEQAIAGS